ncbi:MAG TPA: hypothetical protein VF656_19860 [Pyrinomonadaceae bacterium]|jgi:hypothetical protein
MNMRRNLLKTFVLVLLACGAAPSPAPAQLPGGLPRIPRPGRPKPTPTPAPTQTETAPTAPTAPAQPDADMTPAATSSPAVAASPQRPTGFDKNWLMVSTDVHTSYKGNYDVWSWSPYVKFRAYGGLPGGASYYAEFMQPGGAPWIKIKCEQNGDTYTCNDRDDAKGITASGLIPFAIKIRNPLEGTEQTVFTGKAKVDKAPSSDVERNKLTYYVNHDWALPVGYVFRQYDGHLGFAIWVHSDNSSGLEPHVFYNGAEVGLATLNGEPVGHAGCGSSELAARPSRDVASSLANKGHWERMGCDFTNIYWGDKEHTTGSHVINQHPGEYEIKVLWNKRLARSIKFTVNPDGSIKDTGIAAANGFGTDRVMVPVKVLGTQDGTWDQNAWKTEAFYGNLLKGFNWPPQ